MGESRAGDAFVERAGRWLAARQTRRSFLGRMGRLSVLLAGGPALASLLADQAEARVCGQSGVSLRCPTYDCNDVWGWCWYATGCCADGALKKICDCCALHFPNVHGYCPPGHNVKCIVESCGADPRLMTVATHRIVSDDFAAVAALGSRARFAAGSAPTVYLVQRLPHVVAVAATLAAADGVPLLVAVGDGVPAQTVAELQRLGARDVVLVGSGHGSPVGDELARYGIGHSRFAGTEDLAALSVEVGDRVRAKTGARRAIAIAPSTPADVAAAAGGAAAALKLPLWIGRDAAVRGATSGDQRAVLTYLVGSGAAAFAGDLPGGHPVVGPTSEATVAELSRLIASVERAAPSTVAVVPVGSLGAAAGAAAAGGPVLLHAAGRLDPALGGLLALRNGLQRVLVAGAGGALPDEGVLQVQAAANRFEAHKLTGVAGQGLPVIDQPLEERPIGRARAAGAPAPQPMAPFWTSRGDGA